ncbi:MAG: hypothetical protein PHW15_00460 [Patescibacteria group bacterium]|jgi:hypothetical protein|nr:hypothetical protein [Patescibacteria group bacterium]MDD5172874.1 hypothetical protein [Patescibacteria group bacterium]
MEEISNKQLQLTKWYLDNRNKFYKIFLKFLILFSLVFWGWAVYNFTNYLLAEEEHEQMLIELVKDRINYLKFHEHFSPHDLVVVKSIFLSSNPFSQSNKKYDFLAIVENENENLIASSVQYYFFWETGQTEIKETFILPGEKKYLTVFGQEVEGKPTKVQFAFLDTKWQRIDFNEPSPAILSNLTIEEIKLDYIIAKEQHIAVPKISFKIKNQSIYSLWQADFKIILYRGSEIIGMNVLTVKQWRSNEKREMELLWPNIPSHDRIAVILEINPFDPEIFMPVY